MIYLTSLAVLAAATAGLRFVGIIHWPWLWALAPVWIPLGLFVLLAILCAAIEQATPGRRWMK